jgi:P27 family predicted phage terminase small subunit
MAGNHRSGRRSAPSSVKRLRGNPRINDREPVPAGRLPSCPDRLTGRAREAWITFAAALNSAGIGTSLDAVALELLCDSYGLYLDAMEHVSRTGPVWFEAPRKPGKLPRCFVSPWQKIAKVAWGQSRVMMLEFGLTPTARVHIKVDRPTDAADELEQFVSSKR